MTTAARRYRPDPVPSRAGRPGRVDPSLTAWRRTEVDRLTRRGDSQASIAVYLGISQRHVGRLRARQRQAAA